MRLLCYAFNLWAGGWFCVIAVLLVTVSLPVDGSM